MENEEKKFDQSRAWEIFESYARNRPWDSFNVVADCNYGSVDGFYQSAIEFVNKKDQKKFRKELEAEFGTWGDE